MKNYRQLVKELPSKKVVFAFGRFQPPTTGHELLVKAVKKIAGSTADHVIFASKSEDKKSNPLPVERKVYYLKRMFPKTNFQAANNEIRTFIEAAKFLNKKYKNIVMVAGSDRVPEYTRILNTYNGKEFHFDTVEVVSAGERDPDSDSASGMSGTKMREAAKKGDFEQFKKGVPHTLTDLDARRLMNDIRKGMGMEVVKEQFNLVKDTLREQYFRGEIFNIGDIVESADEHFEIVKRGTNHLLVKAQDGSLVSKWLKDVTVVQESTMNEDLTDKTLKNSDKIKVARIIADAFGVENAEASSGPEQLVNAALRKIKSKPFTADSLKIIGNMLQLAAEVGIKYDNNLVPSKLKEGTIQPNGTDKIDVTTTYSQFKKKITKVEPPEHKDNESDQDSGPALRTGEQGSTLVPDDHTENNRRLKVKAKLGEDYDAAEKHKEKATAAQAKGDQEAYHHHMSNHHEEMGKWHESKGRHNSAQISFDKAEEHHEASIQTKKVQKEEAAGVQEEPAGKHRVQVTISDPNHTSVSKRKEQIQKHIRVSGEHSEESAVKKATAHYKKQGYKVHSAEHVGMVKEEAEQIDEISSKLAGDYYGAATKKHIEKVGVKKDMYNRIEKDMGKNRKAGVDRALDRITGARKTNEEVDQIDEVSDEAKANYIKAARKSVQALDKAGKEEKRDQRSIKANNTYGSMSDKAKKMANEEVEQVEESMTDSWKKVQSMDKGSVTGGKDEVKKRLAYLQAVHAHHKKFGNDTKKVKKDIESINRSRLAEGGSEIEEKEPDNAYIQRGNVTEDVAEGFDPMFQPNVQETDADDYPEFSDKDIDDMVNTVDHEDDILDLYDDDEYILIDAETGEEIKEELEMDEEALNEVLSRSERMRAKMRFARTKAKRERRMQIALHSRSNTTRLNSRSRKMAIKLMKQRMAKKPLAQLSVGEKERIERTIQKRKAVVDRLALKLAPRIRKIENDRLSHKKVTK